MEDLERLRSELSALPAKKRRALFMAVEADCRPVSNVLTPTKVTKIHNFDVDHQRRDLVFRLDVGSVVAECHIDLKAAWPK